MAITNNNCSSYSTCNDNEIISSDGLKIGFIGFGTIASSIALGMATQTKFPVASITISRRSASKSHALQQKFPHLVTISDDTQEIIDQSSDFIFLCVLPEMVSKVLQQDVVTFQNNTSATLVSVVASADLDELVKLTSLPTSRVAKMICTPSIAQHEGVCLLHHPRGDDDDSSTTTTTTNSYSLPKLLDAIGGCVECTSTEQMNVLMSGMCVMGPIYGLLQTHIDWLKSKGVSNKDANFLVTRQYTAILRDATTTTTTESADCNMKDETKSSSNSIISDDNNGENRVEQLIQEQTRNGINEQALDNWKRLGSLKSYTNVLDAIVDRLEKKSDGSVVEQDEQVSSSTAS